MSVHPLAAEQIDQERRLPELDVVGIGAINHDFIFRYKPGRDDPRGLLLDQGPEHLGGVTQEIATRIVRRFRQDPEVAVQVGGSAYLAIKTIAAMNLGLQTGFVGVYGTADETEREVCPGLPAEDDFRRLSDREWLFRSTAPPGRALVLVRRGRRVEIRIATGANADLIHLVRERIARRDPDVLARYIASARWVHVSSLARFEDFSTILAQVKRAKDLNRSLRCSIDPGYEYAQNHSNELNQAFDVADFIFLTETEAQHLAGGPDVGERLLIERLGELGSNTRVLIVKSKNRHTLVHQVLGIPVSRRYWHLKLSTLRIRNDTGAGDVLAGGFIAALLTDALIAHQPAAVRLGAILAGERLKSEEFPASRIAIATERYLLQGQKRERLNRRQHIRMLWETYHSITAGFGIGVISSIVATLALLWLGL